MAETAQEVVDAAPAGRAMLDLSALERISAGLAALTTEGQRLLEKADPTDKGDDKALRAFRKRCVEVRVAAHRVYDEQNKPVLDLQRKMRRLRDDIEASVEKIEEPVDRLILAEEQRKEAARRAEAEREQRRIADMRQRIAGIGAMVVAMIGKASDEIEEQIALVTAIEIGPEWAEFEGEARAAQQAALDKLRAMRQTAVEQAEHDRQLRAERDAAERKLHYQRLIGALRESSFRFTMSTPAAVLEDAIATLEATALSIDDWDEFLADAEQARDAALAELRTLLDTAKRLADMDRVAAEQRKRQAELDEAAAALTQREQAMAVPADAPLVATPEGDRGPSALSGWQGAVERLQSGEPIQPPPGTQLREDLTAFALAEPERKFWPGCEGEPANGQQGDLDGIQSLQLTPLAKRLGSFRWSHDMIGYEMTFDLGLGGARSNLSFSTGAVGAWLGFALTSGFIEQTLGVPGEPGVGSKAARLWTRVQLDQIRVALIKHLQALRGPL